MSRVLHFIENPKKMKWLDRRSAWRFLFNFFLKTGHTHHPPSAAAAAVFSCCLCVIWTCAWVVSVQRWGDRGRMVVWLTVHRKQPSLDFVLLWFILTKTKRLSSLSLVFCLFFRSVLSLPSPWLRSLVFTLRSAGACGGAYFWKREMSVEKRERQIYSFDLSVVLRCVRQTPRQPRLPATWAQSSNKLNKCGHDPLVPWLRWFHKFIFVSFKFKFSSFFNYIFFCSFGFWLDWFSWT